MGDSRDTSAVRKAIEKKYFIGRTPDLTQTVGNFAYIELRNPINSGMTIFINVWNASNIGSADFRASFFFNASHAGVLTGVTDIVPTNRLAPLIDSKAEMNFIANTTISASGINAFIRAVPAFTSVVDVEDGRFIIPPGEAWGIFLSQFGATGIGFGAFGWWEEAL